MIPGLHSYAREHLLVTPVDLSNATIGISAEQLAGLNSAEIMARLGRSSDSPVAAPSSAPAANPAASSSGAGSAGAGAKPAGSSARNHTFVVVFDGPTRTTASRLDDGLERRRIVRALHDAHIPFIVAPALAAAQLAYMFQEHYISHVAGADEALLWADVPLILDVFAEHPQMLRRHALLAHLRLGEQAFIEVVLGAGQNAVAELAFPFLDKVGNPIESAVRNAIQFGGPAPPPVPPPAGSPPPPPPPSISVYRAAQAVCDPAYVAALQRALTFVWRQPVLATDGTILLQDKTGQPVPKDLTEIIGCQLSPEVYWYLSRGIIGPELLKGMLWATFSDCYSTSKIPAESHAAFERLQLELSPLRQQAYALLVIHMHRYFQVKEVVNRTSGGLNFVRTSPSLPTLTAGNENDPNAIVADAIQHVRQLADLNDMPISDMPEALALKSLSSTSTPATILVQAATLALRELLESVVFWFIAAEKVPRSIDTVKLVHAFPWA